MRQTRGEVLYEPPPDAWTATAAGRFATSCGFSDYASLHAWSIGDLDAFWRAATSFTGVRWHDPPTSMRRGDEMPGVSWFPGATLNYADQALATAASHPGDVAVVARSQTRGPSEITWGQLAADVAAAAAGLRALGVRSGDRVVAYAPNIPETLVAFLATASVGAIWSSCPPEFGTRAVVDRFSQLAPAALIAVDGYRYGEKDIDRAEAVDEIVAGLPTLRHVVDVPYLRADGSARSPPSAAGATCSPTGRRGRRRRSRPSTRCTCCSAPARPACRKRSSTVTAASSPSTSRCSRCTRTSARTSASAGSPPLVG